MALDIDRHAHVASPLNRWDPRFKILSLGVAIFAIALLKAIPLAIAALVFALVLLRLARLPRDFVAHGIQFVLIFLLPFLIIMPLTYPGTDDTTWLGLPFAWEGLRLGILVVIKSVSIVLIAYAIFGTSRFDVSMIALQRLKCPQLFVQMILFTYRYIFVFIAEMRRMDVAMKARGFVKKPNMDTLRVLGNFVGTLIVRSFERTERIYKAMLSKGYHGEFYTLTTFHAVNRDYLKAALSVSLAVILLAIDASHMFNQAEQGWF